MVVVSFEGSNQAFFTTDYTDLSNYYSSFLILHLEAVLNLSCDDLG